MEEYMENRLTICNSCEFLHEDNCILCGCEVKSKVKIANEKCPMMPPKWIAYNGALNIPMGLGSGGFNSPSQEQSFTPVPVVCAVCPRRS